MDRDHLPSTYDRDFDRRPQRPPGLSDFEEPFEAHQRLIANPFLAILSWVAAIALIRTSLRHHSLALFLVAGGLFIVAFFLLQFHCLDCGKTGWLLRSRMHACPPLRFRSQDREVRCLDGRVIVGGEESDSC